MDLHERPSHVQRYSQEKTNELARSTLYDKSPGQKSFIINKNRIQKSNDINYPKNLDNELDEMNFMLTNENDPFSRSVIFSNNKRIEIICDYIYKSEFVVFYIEELCKNNKQLKKDLRIFYTEIDKKDIENFKEMNIDINNFDIKHLENNIYQVWFHESDEMIKFLELLDEYPLEFKILDKNYDVLYNYKNIV